MDKSELKHQLLMIKLDEEREREKNTSVIGVLLILAIVAFFATPLMIMAMEWHDKHTFPKVRALFTTTTLPPPSR